MSLNNDAFKCVNYNCRNFSFVEDSLCRYCKDSPYGYSPEELRQYGTMPFKEMQQHVLGARREEQRRRLRAQQTHIMRESGPKIVLPSHFTN